MCIHLAQNWAKRKGCEKTLLCYFEDGDKDRANFEKLARVSNRFVPLFLPKSEVAAFQAADFAGWKIRTSIQGALKPGHTHTDGLRLLDSVAALRTIPFQGAAA
jgi:hypothetical protein